ncbi:HCP-like protein [Lichtheimia hyalospora FSU 10163]|nr:HCP-like protein [Lichtheimia hyalospora FSU 10163]
MGAQQSHQAQRTSTSSSGTNKRGGYLKEQQSKDSSNSTDDEIESFHLSSNATAIRRNGAAINRTPNNNNNNNSNSEQRISTYSTTSSSSDQSSLGSTLFSLASTSTSNSLGTTPPSSFSSCHSSSTKRHHHGHEGIMNNNAYSNVRRYTAASRPNKIVDIFMSRVSTTSSHSFNTASLPLDVDYAFNTLMTLAKTDCAAHVPLAICYDYGFTPNRQQDLQKALMWYKRAVAGSNDDTQKTMIAFAHYRIGIILSSFSSNHRHHLKQKRDKNEPSSGSTTDATVVEHFRIAATQGNAMGQYALGMWYLKQQDMSHAREWLLASANQGCDVGQEALGSLLIDYSKDNERSEKQQGIHYIRLAADQNNGRALYRMGTLYEEGGLITQDTTHAMAFYEQAASIADNSDEDNTSTSLRARSHYAAGIHRRIVLCDYERALHHLTVAAKCGHASAQRALGLMYAEGLGTTRDEIKAHKLYSKAAAQGDVRALGLLAKQYETGRACVMDIKRALYLYEKAAAAGSIAATLSLAELLQRNDHPTEAFPWFEHVAYGATCQDDEQTQFRNKARLMVARYRLHAWGNVKRKPAWAFNELLTLADCDQYAPAYVWVGTCYKEGVMEQETIVVQRDMLKAYEYYEKAAHSGDADGQFQVAHMLANGITEQPMGNLIAKDTARALQWYTKAADAGHMTAQYSLGLYYANGISPATKDMDRASRLFEQAALQGSVDAMIHLAKIILHDNGREALYWLQKAAANGDPAGVRELAAIYESDVALPFLKNKNARYNAAYQLFKRTAVEHNDPLSWCALARYHENGWVVSQSLDEAVACFTKAENLDHASAGLAMADMFERHEMWDKAMEKYTSMATTHKILSLVGWKARLAKGRLVLSHNQGTLQDMKDVHGWLSEMVEHNTPGDKSIEPFEMLGACCEYGKGTTKDITSAMTWYEAAIHVRPVKQSPNWIQERARFRLAVLHMQLDQHKDALNYFKQFEPLLEKMNHHSPETRQHARVIRYHLGYLLHRGNDVESDRTAAKQWFQQASDEGEGRAAYELGMMALEEDDDQEARKRFDQGVSARHAGCIRQFALLLERDQRDDLHWDGHDVMEWLEDAARLGDIEALMHLGRAYEHGLGKDYPPGQLRTALQFYVAAAQQGHVRAMVKAGELYSRTGRHYDAVCFFKKAASKDLTARAMLASYRLQGKGGMQQDGSFVYLESLVREALLNMDDCLRNQEDKHGMGLALFLLGQCYEVGKDPAPLDLETAKKWYTVAVNVASHAEAMCRLGLICSLQGNDEASLDWYRMAAEKGRLREAQYQVGLFHKEGRAGLESNIIAARNYFAKAADQGHSRAKYELAHILWRKGEHQKAFHLYDIAAKLMVPEAMRALGNIYHQGFNDDKASSSRYSIPRDYARAFTIFCESAKLGDAVAALMVGTYFQEGYLDQQHQQQQDGSSNGDDSKSQQQQQSEFHIGIDYDQALQWYEMAYKLGCGPLAEIAMGNIKHIMAANVESESWENAEELREEAYTWFCRASSSMAPETQYATIMVALYHIHGWGRVQQDSNKGLRLLREMADAGGTEAYVELAKCYEEGIGVEQDMVQALTFWELAAATHNVAALLRAGEFHERGLAGQVNINKATRYYAEAKASGARVNGTAPSSSASSSSSSSYTPTTHSSSFIKCSSRHQQNQHLDPSYPPF